MRNTTSDYGVLVRNATSVYVGTHEEYYFSSCSNREEFTTSIYVILVRNSTSIYLGTHEEYYYNLCDISQ